MSEATRSSSSSPAVLLAGLALLVSLGHLAYDLSAPPPQPEADEPKGEASVVPAARAGECRCDDGPVRREIAELRDALALVRARTSRAAAAPGSARMGAPSAGAPAPPFRAEPSEHELAMSLPADEPLPKIRIFMDVPAGVKLLQRRDGTLEPVVTDPEAGGKQYVVYALTEKGETILVRFTVP